jgi:hypothetical protein
MKPEISIVDANTGEQIVREMNDDELEQYEADQLTATQRETKIAEAKVRREAAEAKLEALGLTADDLKALGF